MDTDLLIPLFWTIIFGALLLFGVRKLSKKAPTEKKWVRPEPKSKEEDD